MMPPRAAMLLGILAALPFLAGLLAVRGMFPGVDNPVTGYLILQSHGIAMLAFGAGALWGIAAQAGRRGWLDHALPLVPGFWAFGVTFAPDALQALMMGFAVLAALDVFYRFRGLGPRWWLLLRLPFAAVALAALHVGGAA